MEVTEISLRERYSQMESEELIELAAAGNLTDMASVIVDQVLNERGIKEEDRGKLVERLESEFKKNYEIVSSLAPMGHRIIAQIIDSIVAAVILIVPIILLTDNTENLFIIAVLAYFGYLLFQDGLPNGQSIGKRMMGLSVINIKTGMPCSLLASLVRNIFLFFLGIIDILFIVSRYRQRLGDKVASTVVVKTDSKFPVETEVVENTAPKTFPW